MYYELSSERVLSPFAITPSDGLMDVMTPGGHRIFCPIFVVDLIAITYYKVFRYSMLPLQRDFAYNSRLLPSKRIPMRASITLGMFGNPANTIRCRRLGGVESAIFIKETECPIRRDHENPTRVVNGTPLLQLPCRNNGKGGGAEEESGFMKACKRRMYEPV